jgi:hypothetical protein
VQIRQQRRIRLPDAIIWASAQEYSLLLVSRNTKDFPANEPGVRVPYKIQAKKQGATFQQRPARDVPIRIKSSIPNTRSR